MFWFCSVGQNVKIVKINCTWKNPNFLQYLCRAVHCDTKLNSSELQWSGVHQCLPPWQEHAHVVCSYVRHKHFPDWSTIYYCILSGRRYHSGSDSNDNNIQGIWITTSRGSGYHFCCSWSVIVLLDCRMMIFLLLSPEIQFYGFLLSLRCDWGLRVQCSHGFCQIFSWSVYLAHLGWICSGKQWKEWTEHCPVLVPSSRDADLLPKRHESNCCSDVTIANFAESL